MIDFTNNENGGGSFSSASLALPTGTEALTDTALYSYIKGLYDNGNTVLENNYTTVGSPTISENGIVSGFSQSDYLQTAQFSLMNPFELIIRGSVNSGISGNNYFIGNGGFNINSIVMAIGVTDTYALRLSIHKDNTGSVAGTEYAVSEDNIISPNTYYYFKVNYDGTKYVLTYSTDGITYTSACTVNYSSLPHNNSNIKLAIGGSYTDQLWGVFNGSIDLNSFSIKSNNKIIYQGKYISCKQTSSGSKIVDVSNASAVNSIFNSAGSAPYFVIDTVNETVTLPKGDLFGFITQALN